MLKKYVQAEQIETMSKIKMKTASMFTKVVAVFLLYPMLFFMGKKLEAKVYVHLVYWIIMLPVLYCMGCQIKGGNTINKTRCICAGLIIRILLSNFDFEGKQLGKDYYVRIIGLTINMLVAGILTMFLSMFNDRYIVSVATTVMVATISSFASFAWQSGSYDDTPAA